MPPKSNSPVKGPFIQSSNIHRYCSECERPINAGDTFYTHNGPEGEEIVCEDCQGEEGK